MGLSDDQKAMLRLVAQRGEQGYEDIAALKGLSVEEVRAQVAAALAQLDDEGALSGSAPTEPAEAPAEKAEAPAPEPEPPKAAEKPEPAPAAKAPAAPPSPASPKQPRKLSVPTGAGLRAAIAGVVIVVALVVIVAIVSSGGGGGGGEDSSTSSASGDQTTAGNQPVTSSKQVTKAILGEVEGSGAQGVAIFGRFKNKLALELAAEGLEPTPRGTSYTVWLAASPRKMLPLASTAVPKSGKIGAQFEVPVEVLGYLANETFSDIVVTRTDDATLEAALAAATKAKEAPSYTGDAVLSGTVTGPVVGAQIRQEEKEKEEGE